MTKLGASPKNWAAASGTGRMAMRVALLVAALASAGLVRAAPGGASIFTCTDAKGNRVTSDRFISPCTGDQRELNADGSLKRIVPPTLTIDERTEEEARARAKEIDDNKKREAINRDRNLLTRFPNEAAHRKARETALGDIGKSLSLSEARLIKLAEERKPLLEDGEFYKGKPLPGRLRQQLDANDAAVEAQRDLVQNQQAEIIRINTLFDSELERLKKLWSGATPGSMGVLAADFAASAPRKAALK